MYIKSSLFALLSLFLLSCSEELVNLSGSSSANSTLTATINGSSWEASAANGAHAPVVSALSNGNVQIEGFVHKDNGDKETLVVIVEDQFNGAGTYKESLAGIFIKDEADSYRQYSLTAGPASGAQNTVTFSTYDESAGRASGTFSCVMYYNYNGNTEELVITDGVFENLRIDQLNVGPQ